MIVFYLEADVKVRPIYECHGCRSTRPGDTVFLRTVAANSTMMLKKLIDDAPTPPSNMPVGWASFGRGVYKCEICKEK